MLKFMIASWFVFFLFFIFYFIQRVLYMQTIFYSIRKNDIIFKNLITVLETKSFEVLFILGSLLLLFILTFFGESEYLSFYQNGLNENIESLSFLFVWLTIFIVFVCSISIFFSLESLNFFKNELILALLFTQACLISLFGTENLITFFIMFELSSLPLFYLIFEMGPTFRKKKAILYFLGYTCLSATFLILGVSIFYYETNQWILNAETIQHLELNTQLTIWLFLFLGLAVKLPIVPFHLWLLEAHVEAPTYGSVILAALLLKIGGYGIIRFCIYPFPVLIKIISPWIILLGILSMFIATLCLFVQIDLKRIIAYSSVIHMNASLVCLFTHSEFGVIGSIISMVAHGFTSSGLFLCAGYFYQLFHSKNIIYLTGLNYIVPTLSRLFFILILTNIAFPGSLNFLAEILIFLSLINVNKIYGLFFLLITSIVFIYFMWLINRIHFGTPNFIFFKVKEYCLCKQPINVSIYLLVFILIGLGILPGFLFNYLNIWV